MNDIKADILFEERLEQEVRRVTGRLRSELDTLQLEKAELQKVFDVSMKLGEAAAGRPPVWTRKPKGRSRRSAIIMAQLTDTHFDEVVTPEQIEFINAYNRAIAEQRLHRWVDKVIVQAREYLSQERLDIEGLVVPATGDILSGDIHEELAKSNEDHLYRSAVHWIEQLVAAFRLLLKEFKKVHVACVVGNHGRSTIKPVFKGRAWSNIEWLLWHEVAARFVDDDGITFTISDSMDLSIKVYTTNYVLTHGDQFRGGSGISAELAPLLLGVHRKTVRQMATDSPMDYMVLGHFHQYMPPFRGMIMGGSMKGYDEYAYGLNLRPEPARQAMWVSTPERGPTISLPVELQDRKAEGW